MNVLFSGSYQLMTDFLNYFLLNWISYQTVGKRALGFSSAKHLKSFQCSLDMPRMSSDNIISARATRVEVD